MKSFIKLFHTNFAMHKTKLNQSAQIYTWKYSASIIDLPVGLGNISILSFIVIFKCHDNRYHKDFSVS